MHKKTLSIGFSLNELVGKMCLHLVWSFREYYTSHSTETLQKWYGQVRTSYLVIYGSQCLRCAAEAMLAQLNCLHHTTTWSSSKLLSYTSQKPLVFCSKYIRHLIHKSPWHRRRQWMFDWKYSLLTWLLKWTAMFTKLKSS